MNQLIESVEKTFKENLAILIAKNADYTGEDVDPYKNFRNSEVVGVDVDRAILVRIMDKMGRISSLLDKDPQVASESLTDSISDAINYFAILKAYLEQK